MSCLPIFSPAAGGAVVGAFAAAVGAPGAVVAAAGATVGPPAAVVGLAGAGLGVSPPHAARNCAAAIPMNEHPVIRKKLLRVKSRLVDTGDFLLVFSYGLLNTKNYQADWLWLCASFPVFASTNRIPSWHNAKTNVFVIGSRKYWVASSL
jgi:hypothetical protein